MELFSLDRCKKKIADASYPKNKQQRQNKNIKNKSYL